MPSTHRRCLLSFQDWDISLERKSSCKCHYHFLIHVANQNISTRHCMSWCAMWRDVHASSYFSCCFKIHPIMYLFTYLMRQHCVSIIICLHCVSWLDM
jgi:hypothetical protein